MFKGKKILLVGSHPDDLEFGCGATLNQIKNEDVRCVIFSDTTNLNGELILKELENSLSGVYGVNFTLMRNIKNMNFVNQEVEIKQKLYDMKNEFKPDIILSVSRKSHNPDHRVLGESVLSVFQEQTVLFYEVVRGDYEFQPNFYNEVSEEDAEIKQDAIRQYITQTKKRDYAKSNIILSQLTFRGSQILKKYAEAFEVGRIVV